MTQIRRQQDKDYREAVYALSKGQTKDGLEKLEKWAGCKAVADTLKMLQKVTLNHGIGPKLPVVAPTWAEIDKVNAHIRERLKAQRSLEEGSKSTVLRSRIGRWLKSALRAIIGLAI